MIQLLLPSSPLNKNKPDDLVAEQYDTFLNKGFQVTLFSVESLQAGTLALTLPSQVDLSLLYRGWMLDADDYEKLCDIVARSGHRMLIDLDLYLHCHHLPNWYPLISKYTAETVIASESSLSPGFLKKLGWQDFFIKDYVKSLKTSRGSHITDIEQLPFVLAEMKHFRGKIEGGICLRRFENFRPDTETRYFIVNGHPHAPDPSTPVPTIVNDVIKRIKSPFYTVDIAQKDDGELRVIEIGDGQVSDLVGWSPDRIADLIRHLN